MEFVLSRLFFDLIFYINRHSCGNCLNCREKQFQRFEIGQAAIAADVT